MGKWPDEFTNTTYQLQDAESNYWKVSLTVEKTDKVTFFADMNSGRPTSTYCLVYNDKFIGNHCVYVRDFDDDRMVYRCINSHGPSDPNPEVAVTQPGNILYRVKCQAEPMGSPAPSPPASLRPSLDRNVMDLLLRLGLEEHVQNFEREEVTTMEDVRNLSKADLKEIGMTLKQRNAFLEEMDKETRKSSSVNVPDVGGYEALLGQRLLATIQDLFRSGRITDEQNRRNN